MEPISITVNGEKIETLVEPRTHLADFLREGQRLTGTHLGCEHGICGSCTVLLDEQPARSCLSYAVACDGREVRTIEGFNDDLVMVQLRAAFNREHALQCGFCTPGMLITARDLILRSPEADEVRVRIEMSGNLCRCTGYQGIVRAILSVISLRQKTLGPNFESIEPTIIAPAFKPFLVSIRDTKAFAEPTKPSYKLNNQGTVIEDEFIVDHPLSYVWKTFAHIPTVVNCLPGAEIIEQTAKSLKGKIRTKLGPMRTVFVGSAAIERDDGAKSGIIHGHGTDSLSGSLGRGNINYQLYDEGVNRTRVKVSIDYSMQGPLAQFSRSGLVKEFIKNLLGEFAINLNSRLGNPAEKFPGGPSQIKITLSKICWIWLTALIKRLFGSRT